MFTVWLLIWSISAIFQAGGLIVVVVEVTRKAFLASLVPVIVDAILNEHQVVADIVAFVSHGDFPRSRLGEKQRGKVLASWVTRKLRTIAQFSIRDLDDNPFAEMPQHRVSRSSKPGSTMGNSLRRSTMNMNPEPELPAVPQTHAPVRLEESIETPQQPLQDNQSQPILPELDTQTNSAVSRTPVPAATSTVPFIQEPQSATIVTEDDDHFDISEPSHDGSTGPTRDFRFSFDIVNTPMDPLPYESAATGADRPSTGRESLPSQQSGGHNSGVGVAVPAPDEKPRPGTQESGLVDDWPQEALMYQSTLDGQDIHHAPSSASAAVRQRYDGSGYES